MHRLRGEYDSALEFYEKSLEIVEKIGDQAGIAESLNSIGQVHQHRGEYDKALEFMDMALDRWEKVGNSYMTAETLGYMAEAQCRKGNLESAMDLCNRSFDMSKEIPDRILVGYLKKVFGMTYREQEKWKESIENFESCIDIFSERDPRNLAISSYEFGLMWERKGDKSMAEDCYGRALGIFENLKIAGKIEDVKGQVEALRE